MNREQEEILLRIKLLMGYNTKKTLSENFNNVLSEQPRKAEYIPGGYQEGPRIVPGGKPKPRTKIGQGASLKVPDQSDSSNLWYMTIFLNANPDKIKFGQPYHYLWKSYVDRVAGASLDALLSTRTRVLDNPDSYDLGLDGGIAPDLNKFKPENTGVATALLDGEIYAKRLEKYEADKEKWDTTSFKTFPGSNFKFKEIDGQYKYESPKPPKNIQFALLKDSNVPTSPGQASPLFNNTKSTLEDLDAYNKDAKQVSKEYNQLLDTPFKNTEESNKFRKWLLGKYPIYGNKPKPYNVELISPYTNSEALKIAYKERGKEYEQYLLDLKRRKQKLDDDFLKNTLRRETIWLYLQNEYKKNKPGSYGSFQQTDYRADSTDKNKGIPPKPQNEKWRLVDYDRYYEALASQPLDNSSTWWDFGLNIYDFSIDAGFDKEFSEKVLKKFGTKNEKDQIFWRNYTQKKYEKENSPVEIEKKQKEEKKKSDEKFLGEIFNRKQMWEKLQNYYKIKYPGLTQTDNRINQDKNKGIPPKGKTYKTQGITYDYYYELLASEPLDYSSTWWDIGLNIYDFSMSIGFDKEFSKKVLEKFGTKNEKQEIFWRDYKQKRYNKLKSEKEQEIYDEQEFFTNKTFWEIFGKEKLLDAKKNCPYKLHYFLEKIKNGEIYDVETGQKYGTYKSDGSMVVWPAKKPIPCVSKTWEEWEPYVIWGSMILSIALTIPSIGVPLTLGASIGTRLFIAAALDVGSNLVAAGQNMRAGNEEEAKMDVAIAILSGLVEIPAVSKFLTKGFDDWGEQALREEFARANIRSYKEFKQWISTKTPYEQMVFRNVLDDASVQAEIKLFAESTNSPITRVTEAMEGHIGRITGKSKMGNLRTTLWQNIKYKVPITLSPVAISLGEDMYNTIFLALGPIIGKDPSENDIKIFHENLQKRYPNIDAQEFAEKIEKDPKKAIEIAQDSGFIKDKVDEIESKFKQPCDCDSPPDGIIDDPPITLGDCLKKRAQRCKEILEKSKKQKEETINVEPGTESEHCKTKDCKEEAEEFIKTQKKGGEPEID